MALPGPEALSSVIRVTLTALTCFIGPHPLGTMPMETA